MTDGTTCGVAYSGMAFKRVQLNTFGAAGQADGQLPRKSKEPLRNDQETHIGPATLNPTTADPT